MSFGEHISGLTADGREERAAVFDEHEVRAAAGVTMVVGALGFVCLSLMWMEAVLGVCVGSALAGLRVRRGWAAADPAFEICAHGACGRDGPR